MATLDPFVAVRPSLLSLAQHMLNSSSDARAVVQEAWLRWQAIDARVVRSPQNWLRQSVRRLCLERRAPRLASLGQPSGFATGSSEESLRELSTREPLDIASSSPEFMDVLGRLAPIERAVYLLHQMFDYPLADVAAELCMPEAAVRQAFQHAVEHLAAHRPHFTRAARAHARN
jgi:RNA polymerase sigma-70 factor (ECF subfamily)